MARQKDAQTPAGTTKGGGVYPLAPTLPYNQEVTPVTILSTIDSNGKQVPYSVAEEGGLLDSLEDQGGSISISNGGFGFSDVIDCSLFDGILLFNWLNQLTPILDNRIEIDIVGGGMWTAQDGTAFDTVSTKLPITKTGDSATFIQVLNDPTPEGYSFLTTTGAPTGIGVIVINGLHGLKFRLRYKNNDADGIGGAITLKCYTKAIGFKGA